MTMMESQSKVMKVEPKVQPKLERVDAREFMYTSVSTSVSVSNGVPNSSTPFSCRHVDMKPPEAHLMKREVTRSHLSSESVCPSSYHSSIKEEKEPQRPPHSYAALITMAIRSSPEQQLFLKDIYSYVMKHFPFYKKEQKGWMNSIRHNLSLNKNFLRKPAPNRTEGRKSSVWYIDPASEDMFENGDYRRRKKSKASASCSSSRSTSYRRGRVDQDQMNKMLPDVTGSLVPYDVNSRMSSVHSFTNHPLEHAETLATWHQSHHQVVPKYPESVGAGGYTPLMLTVGSSCPSYQEQTSPPQPHPHPLANYQFVYPCHEAYPPSNGQAVQYVRSE